MSLATKIMLSDLEQAKVMDAEWILTKHRIMEKAQWMMQQQIEPINNIFKPLAAEFDQEILSGTPKISKGENYRKLPFIILDYPAVFSKTDVFALRTLFWWGNHVSLHLKLSGKYLNQFKARLFQNLKKNDVGFFVCINETEWEHHFEPDNYVVANAENIGLLQERNPAFIKISLKYRLEDWNNMPQLLAEGYIKMANLLST